MKHCGKPCVRFYLRKGITRTEAKLILKYMQDVIDRYGLVTLADFHDLAGSKTVVYAADKKIWRSLKGARVSLLRINGHYRITLPVFESIDIDPELLEDLK